jgi:hypothetical protein
VDGDIANVVYIANVLLAVVIGAGLAAIVLVFVRPMTARPLAVGAAAVAAVTAFTIITLWDVSPRGSTGCVDGDPFNFWAGKLALLSLFCALVALLAAGTGRGGKGAWWLAAAAVVATVVGGYWVIGTGFCNAAS